MPSPSWRRRPRRAFRLVPAGEAISSTSTIAAVAAAGKPRGWFAVARAVVTELDLNVNRAGVVFVGARYDRADLPELALRVSDTAAHVYEALLELHDGVG